MIEVEGAAPVDQGTPIDTPAEQTALGGQAANPETLPAEQPTEPKEYSVNIEGFDFDGFKAIPENAELLGRAKEAGLSNDQVNFMLKEYNDIAHKLVADNGSLNTEEAVGQLKEVWGDNYDTSIANAAKALKAAGFTDADLDSPEVGNNVALAKLAAHYGAQMKEDALPIGTAPSTVSEADQVRKMMVSDAYQNPNNPDYASTRKQVAAFYAKGGNLND